ncbi:MAG: Ig-like domain-containing protein [Agriterribacter sp.]
MMPFKRIKKSKRYFSCIALFAVSFVLTAVKGYSQLSISGTTTVVRGNSYSYYARYNELPSYTYNGSYTWTITGGYVTGQSGVTSKSGTNSGVIGNIGINVTWNTTSSTGSLYLTTTLGNKTITITVVAPLNAGTISPTSQSINSGVTATTLTGTAASGGAASPNYSYQWQSSPDAATWTDISGATSQNYSPGTPTTSTYYRRKVTETVSSTSGYTSTATVTVYPALTGSIAASQSINYNTAPATLTSAVTGGNSTYTYQWQRYFLLTYSNISGATSSTYNPGALTGTNYYKLNITSNGQTIATNSVTITVYPQLTCSISASQNINYNTTAASLTSTVGGGNSTYSYQWQSSPDNTNWTNVGTSSTYTPGVLTATTYYRLIATSNGASTTSNTLTITVYPQLTCSISPTSQTITPGASASTFSANVSGGNGTYAYQWQSSLDNINWTNQATTATYNPGTVSTNTFYRVKVTSNGEEVTSNTAPVNVALSSTLAIGSTTPSGDGSVNVMSCTASGGTTYTYTWYASTDGGSTYQIISGANGSSYTTSVVTQTTQYYVAVQSGSYSGNSNTVSVTMPTAPTITSNATSVCNGANATFTASGGSGSYKWYNSTGTSLGTGTTYSTSVSGTYYAVSYSNFGVSPHSSNISLVSLNTPSVSSILGSTVCVIGSSAQLANTVNGGTWTSSNSTIAKIDANGVMSGKASGSATITYTATNACGTSSSQLGITVVPFTDISLTLGNGVADPLITDTISLLENTIKATEFRQDTAYSSAHSIRNVLALRVAEETSKYIPGDFAATAVLKVEYGHSAADIYQLDSIKLNVNYTKNEGSKYNALNYFYFKDAEFTRVTVLRVEAPTTVGGQTFDTKDVLQLTNSLAGMRYYKLADNKKPSLSYTNPASSPIPDELPVSWTLPEHTQNNGVQLEWTWLEDEMKNSYITGGTFDTSLLFKTSATRIDLTGAAAAGSYNIPLLYDGTGTLYMRVGP